jgi:hypothetical protein
VYGPFDTATYGQGPWFRDRGPSEPSGVIGTPAASASAGELGLTAAGFGLSLSIGRAHVRGASYERTGSAWTDTVPANTSSAGPRNDLVVLRRDLVAKTVVPVRIQGTAAASPTDPAVTQNEDGTWDLTLFRVQAPASSGTPLVITDLRRWIDPASGSLLPAYQYPSFTSSWGNYNATSYERCRYYLTPAGDLRIVGVLANASGLIAGQTTTMFNLPAGYRPPRNAIRGALSNGITPQRIDVGSNGDVVHQSSNGALTASTAFVELDLTIPMYE